MKPSSTSIIRIIGLILDPTSFPRRYESDFAYEARFICHFLQSRARKQKVRTQAPINALVVEGVDREPASVARWDHDCGLDGEARFERAVFDQLRGTDRLDYMAGMLATGLEACERYQPIQLEVFKEWLDELKATGYRNEWVAKKKLLRGTGLQGLLRARFQPDAFRLNLELRRKGELVFDERVLETPPDELHFHGEFDDVRVRDGRIVVTNKKGEPIFDCAPPPR